MKTSLSILPHSIRWRVQLWLAGLLVALLSGFGITAYQLYRTTRFGQFDEELEGRVTALASDVRRPPRPGGAREPPPMPGPGGRAEPVVGGGAGHPRFERSLGGAGRDRPERGPPFGPGPDFRVALLREIQLSPATELLFDGAETNGWYYGLWSRDDGLLKRGSNAPPDLAFPGRTPASAGIVTRMRGAYREAFLTLELGEVVLVGRSVAQELAAMHRFAWYLVGVGMAVLALGIGGGWLVADRAIRPVESISQAASRISAGNLAERIDVSEADSELGRLAGVLNNTFDRLEAAFVQQRQFTADASHELRTPLAVMISEAQGALARERTAGEYREAVESCLATAQQMRRLTQSLLELARFDAGQAGLAREVVDLAEVAETCGGQLRRLAERRGISVRYDLQSAPVVGDAARLSQVLTNLLSNAIEYNKENGTVRVATRCDAEAAVVEVRDTGPGIAAEDLEHVFEHFYRGDKARTGVDEEHVGLGLAITKAIVEAHGGTIRLASTPGEGSVFIVRMPAAGEGRPRGRPPSGARDAGTVDAV